MSNLYQDAILDAKALRASAMANAKAALEEAFEPKIQEMISKHLSEEAVEEEVEEVYDMEEVEAVEEVDINETELEEILGQLEEMESSEALNEAEEEEEETEEEEEEESAEETEEVSDETKVIEITVGDLKEILKSVMPGQEMPAAEEESTADSEKEEEVSLEEILAELEHDGAESVHDVAHNGTGYTAGMQAHTKEEAMKHSVKEAKFDKAEAEKILQLYQANKSELDPEAVKAIDAEVAAAGKGLEEGAYADAMLIAQIGGGAILSAMLAALAGVGYAAIKGKLPKRPGKGISDIGPMGEAEGDQPAEGDQVAALAKQAQTNPDEFIKSIEKGAINEVLATTIAVAGAATLAGLAVALATGIAFHVKKQGGLAKVAKTAGPGIMKTVAEAEEGDELTAIANQMKSAFKSANFKQVFSLAKDFYSKATPYFKAHAKVGQKFKSVIDNLSKKADEKPQKGGVFSKISSALGMSEGDELQEARETIEALRKDLQEVNLLNAKYLYMNKLFKSKNLTESQKLKVINTFDQATSVKEVKTAYEIMNESFSINKGQLKESVGFASKPAGVAPKANIVEADQFINRWQKLAGIKK